MTRPRVVAVVILTVCVSAASWLAWSWWPPILRYRLRKIDERTSQVVLDYLDGKQDLGPSARALADLWEANETVSMHMPSVGQWARIVDPGAGVLSERVNDPRLKVLTDSARQLSFRGVAPRFERAERDSS